MPLSLRPLRLALRSWLLASLAALLLGAVVLVAVGANRVPERKFTGALKDKGSYTGRYLAGHLRGEK